jgi:hypothetical protein
MSAAELHANIRPQANGFFGSSGISGRIPEGYTYFEKGFMRAVRKAGRLWGEIASGNFKGVQLSEWKKSDWTYHAKGTLFVLIVNFPLFSHWWHFQVSGCHLHPGHSQS